MFFHSFIAPDIHVSIVMCLPCMFDLDITCSHDSTIPMQRSINTNTVTARLDIKRLADFSWMKLAIWMDYRGAPNFIYSFFLHIQVKQTKSHPVTMAYYLVDVNWSGHGSNLPWDNKLSKCILLSMVSAIWSCLGGDSKTNTRLSGLIK